MSPQQNEIEIIYLAFGVPYLIMALASARTARQHNPGIPITIVTNVTEEPPKAAFWNSKTDRLLYINQPSSMNRNVKTSIVDYVRARKNIFIDCDTIVLGKLDSASMFLDYFDVAMRLNPYPQTKKDKAAARVLGGNEVAIFPHWNSGVILFSSSDKSLEFFRRWNDLYSKLSSPYDQVSLVEVVFTSSARFLSLDRRWNASDPVIGRSQWRRSSYIFHYATNISNRLANRLLQASEMVRGVQPEVAKKEISDFISANRQRKKASIGTVKYLLLRVLWTVSSPV